MQCSSRAPKGSGAGWVPREILPAALGGDEG